MFVWGDPPMSIKFDCCRECKSPVACAAHLSCINRRSDKIANDAGEWHDWQAAAYGAAVVEAERDVVNHPSHYKAHPSGVECIDITEHMNFCLGNSYKYLFRYGLKGDELEQLEKSAWYVRREIGNRTKNEVWAEFPSDRRYQVSSLGRVRRKDSEKDRTLVPIKNGYLTFITKTNGSPRLHYIHRAVMETFVGPCPEGMVVAHTNGNKCDNCLANLRYASVKNNLADKRRHGTNQWGENSSSAKLTEEQAMAIRYSDQSTKDLARKFGVSRSQILRIRKEECWIYKEDRLVAMIGMVSDAEENKNISEAMRLIGRAAWFRSTVEDLEASLVYINREIERLGK